MALALSPSSLTSSLYLSTPDRFCTQGRNIQFTHCSVVASGSKNGSKFRSKMGSGGGLGGLQKGLAKPVGASGGLGGSWGLSGGGRGRPWGVPRASLERSRMDPERARACRGASSRVPGCPMEVPNHGRESIRTATSEKSDARIQKTSISVARQGSKMW